MKRVLALLSIATAAIGFSSCDSHPWEETKVLHDAYGQHGTGVGHSEHGAAKAGHAAPAHEAKPAEAHGEKPKH